MEISIFAYSKQGCKTARKIREFFTSGELETANELEKNSVHCYTLEKYNEGDFLNLVKPTSELYKNAFNGSDILVFVSSCGIAVRNIGSLAKNKTEDPAVIVVDELGKFSISLLSGHIGGANEIAEEVGNYIGAIPVITTATDINKKFSVDAWAKRNNMAISSMKAAKDISAEILERDVPLYSDFPIVTKLPNGVILKDNGKLGIAISGKKIEPFSETLRLIPKVYHLGIGCRRDTPLENIEELILNVLEENNIDIKAVKCGASIDLKKDEKGLLAFGEKYEIPLTFYTAEELSNVEGEFTPSSFVKGITGVDNVCERSALLGASKIIIRKTAKNGVTLSVAEENLEVHFG